MDGFINSEVLKIVGSGYHGRCNRAYLDLEEDGWEDHVPDMDYQVPGNGVFCELYNNITSPAAEW